MKKGNLKTLKRVGKNYKNKLKMKKKIVLMVLFLGVSLMSSNAATSNPDPDQDCFMAAWDYGTRMAKNDRWDDNSEYLQWYYTDQFYRDYCE